MKLSSHHKWIFLLVGIFFGFCLGGVLQEKALVLKPLGDLFLNLLFTVSVPLVFFSISASMLSMKTISEFGRVAGTMLVVFVVTGFVASVYMLVGVSVFPPSISSEVLNMTESSTRNVSSDFLKLLVDAVSVSDFRDLFSKNNILALILFSTLIGVSVSLAGEKGKVFSGFLKSGFEVMMKAVDLIMLYAPIGLGAYFAYLAGTLGSDLVGLYGKALVLYYPAALIYFFGAFSLYVAWACGKSRVLVFWKNIFPTAMTALGTASSVATIPVNLEAANKTGASRKVSEVVIPLGATIHMEGSCLSAILKIAVLHHLFGIPFSGAEAFCFAILVALLSGTVMGGIPGGGFIGEVLIVSLYGFPPEAIAVIATVGILVDAPATMVNAVGDNVASLIVTRLSGFSSRDLAQ